MKKIKRIIVYLFVKCVKLVYGFFVMVWLIYLKDLIYLWNLWFFGKYFGVVIILKFIIYYLY